ncbi:sensor histidine kinase [Sphingobacterium spiritivorum]|uniref:sensor histidine kinase n=1 Tax=Sphingobacterium spiritivorum TaxID=258 RepID=UPI003DA58565
MKRVAKNRMTVIVGILICYVSLVNVILTYSFFPATVIALLTPLNIFLVWIVTTKLLIPKLLARSKIIVYILCSFALIILVNVLVYFILGTSRTLFQIEIDLLSQKQSHNNISAITYIFCTVIYFLNKDKESIIEQKTMEMNMLKSQINSHFLFNALNNIYSMTYFDSKQASDYVMKLSKMLRYVLEECDAKHVLLDKEIEYIEHYLDFQKSRNETDKQKIIFNHNNAGNHDNLVPPMIFQPIIENCFQYCSLHSDTDFIRLDLACEENVLTFKAVNTKSSEGKISIVRSTHIGLQNLRKRLEMNFDNDYSLIIQENNELYSLQLVFKITKQIVS